MKLSLSTVFAIAAARELDLDNALDRLALIEEKFEDLKALIPESNSNFDSRFDTRFGKMIALAQSSFDNKNCKSTNAPDDESDEVNVFTEGDMCALNGQINSALSSWARNFACQGNGRVHRQIVRKSRKIQNFFHDRQNC